MNITCIAFGAIFSVAGIVFGTGKGHIHLKAWKSMPEEERAKIRIVPLCRNIGAMIVLCGIIFLLGGFWAAFKNTAFVWAMIVWMTGACVDVYLIEKSKRYG